MKAANEAQKLGIDATCKNASFPISPKLGGVGISIVMIDVLILTPLESE